jgi:uncharacterized protein (UPF0218 family)
MAGGWRLPESLRGAFKEPVGNILEDSELSKLHDEKTITVGDVVSLTVRESGIVPVLSVYDGMTERREETGFARLVKKMGWEEAVVANPAGTITCEMDEAVKNALNGGTGLIRVVGEEDLALMPCILHAPDGTKVVYGWPGRGMMVVTTDAVARKRVKELWKQMEAFE